MIDIIIIFVLFGAPLVGITFFLIKYSYKQKEIWGSHSTSTRLRKAALLKMIFSIIGSFSGFILILYWCCIFWFPVLVVPKAVDYIFLGLIAITGIGMPLFVGLASAVKSGAGSATGILNKSLKEQPVERVSRKGEKGNWERRSEAEVLEVQKRLKKSSYDPTMPIGVFIVGFIVLYLALGKGMDGYSSILLLSIIASIITYIAQIVKGRSFVGKSSFRICNSCLKEDTIGLEKCPCGGDLEPSELYRFIKM